MTSPGGDSGSREGEDEGDDLPPAVARAADGILPEWARASAERREHMARVADVLEGWARDLGLEPRDVLRWRSLGFLHDALREAGMDELRFVMEAASDAGTESSPGADPDAATKTDLGAGEPSGWRLDWHAFSLDRSGLDEWAPVGGSLHGPAVALRLLEEGVEDEELLSAVAYHTVGHPDLGAAGRALYCADFLEPGRISDRELRAELRARYPEDPGGVLRDVLRACIGYLLERGQPMFLGTTWMWNRASRADGVEPIQWNRFSGPGRAPDPKR